MSPDHIAQCAQAAMLIELSSSPKPGNVDRCHDFIDANFHQFVFSSVSSYPIFRKAATGEYRIGQLLLEAVNCWKKWKIPGNTHFGSLILLIPLAMAARRSVEGPERLKKELVKILQETTVDDAIDFYVAFDLAGARVVDVLEFSLKDPDSRRKLRSQGKTLMDLMSLSKEHDLIAREWSTEFQRCFELSEALCKNVASSGLNDGVVKTYLQALAQVPDSLVQAKFGPAKAVQVSLRAKLALEDETLVKSTELDCQLLAEDVNPGSTADLIAAALFIALLNGLWFER
jgi:triphosphoribosyl-dephospho-CoA synthase